jgi:CheY-like chemotaxis protein
MESFMKPILLIADSNAALCDLCQRFLSDHGYEVETASDGLACLAKLRQVKPAALVLDLNLRWGGSDGVLAWLREQSAAAEVPVVLTATGDSLPEAVEDCEAPVVKLLPKPFALAALLETVRAAVAKKGKEESVKKKRAAPSRISAAEEEEWFMPQPAALLILPTRGPDGAALDNDAAAPLLMESLEDLRLAECVERALRASGYGALRGINVTVQARIVILEGRVPSYYLKQFAQTLTLSVPGVDRVCNNLDVGRRS